MNTITIDRALVEQALKALEMSRRFVYADNRPQCDDAIDALRAALAQQQAGSWQDGVLEGQLRERERWLAQQADKPQRPKCFEFALDFLGTPENGELLAYIEQLEARAALAQQAEPKGGGRLPPPLQAEPVQEPDLFHCPKCGGPADNGHDRSIPPNPYFCTRCMAEPVQEPVAWRFQSAVGGWAYGSQPPLGSKYPVHPLYTVPPRCPNCASLEAQNNELDRKLAEVERAHGIGEQP